MTIVSGVIRKFGIIYNPPKKMDQNSILAILITVFLLFTWGPALFFVVRKVLRREHEYQTAVQREDPLLPRGPGDRENGLE